MLTLNFRAVGLSFALFKSTPNPISALFLLISVWARGRCRISPPRFLAECCKRQLNQGSFVLQYFRSFTFSDLYRVCLSVFSCTVLFVSISQVIGCEDRLRNDLYCVEWGVKLYSNQPILNLVRPTHRPSTTNGGTVRSYVPLRLRVASCPDHLYGDRGR